MFESHQIILIENGLKRTNGKADAHQYMTRSLKNILALICCLAANVTFAQQPLPQAIRPLNQELLLTLNPSFTASCTKNTSEKKDGAAAVASSIKMTVNTFEDPQGNAKYSLVIPLDRFFFKMIVDLPPARTSLTGLVSLEIAEYERGPWKDTETLKGKDKEEITKVKELLGFLFKSLNSVLAIGRPLRQGTLISTDFCSYIPGASTQSSSGGFAVIGLANLNTRENVVLSGSLTSACYIGTDKLEMGVQGWYAVDAESGIISNQAYTTKISLRSKGTTTTVESVNCSIDGTLSKPRTQSPAGTGSAEQRLIELRSLFEKGLIGSEHFKKKQAEIVNGL